MAPSSIAQRRSSPCVPASRCRSPTTICFASIRCTAEGYLAEKLRPLTKMSVEAGLAMADRLMQWVRLRERMWKQYRPGPYSGHVLLFRSSDPGDGMQATADSSAPARGWDIAAQAAVDVEWVPGDHLTIVAEPHVRVLAARLAYSIDRATSEARATMPLSAG